MDGCANFENCERIFVRLSAYWRSALFGFLAILSLGSGVWAWTWAETKASNAEQNTRINSLEAGFNDIAVVRGQANEIIANQKMILKLLARTK